MVNKVPTSAITVDGELDDIAVMGRIADTSNRDFPQIDFSNAAGRFAELNDAFYNLYMTYDNTGLYFGVLVGSDDFGGLNNDDEYYSPFDSDAVMVFLDPMLSRSTRPNTHHAAFIFVAGTETPTDGRLPVPLAGASFLRVGNGERTFFGKGHAEGIARGSDKYGLGSPFYTFEGYISFEALRRRTGLPITVPQNDEEWGIDFQLIDSKAGFPIDVVPRNGRLQVWAPANSELEDERDPIAHSPANWGRVRFRNVSLPNAPLKPPEPALQPLVYYDGTLSPDVGGWSLLSAMGLGGDWQLLEEDGVRFLRVRDHSTTGALAFAHPLPYLASHGISVVARMRLHNGAATNNMHSGNGSLTAYDEAGGAGSLSFRGGAQARLAGVWTEQHANFALDVGQWHTYWMCCYAAGTEPETELYVKDVSSQLYTWHPFRRTTHQPFTPELRGQASPAVVMGSISGPGTVEVDIDWLAVLPQARVFDSHQGGYRSVDLTGNSTTPFTHVGAQWSLYE